MNSKCAAFWKHTNIRNDNRVFPCCRFKYSVTEFTGSLDNIITSDAYEKLRQSSLRGEYIAGCAKCYHEEEIGKESYRQWMNRTYNTDSVSLEFLEIGFDNICNLTCDGCWSEFSSEWAKKEGLDKTIQIRSTDPINSIPNTVNKILFLGGEPLMTTRHIKLLQLVQNKSQVSVTYNTNGTFLFTQSAIDLLKEFQKVHIILSIDGYGELNDRVRSGSKWNDILKFIQQVRTLEFSLEMHTTIHINNWHGLLQVEEFAKEYSDSWTINFLTYPAHLDIINEVNKESLLNVLKSIKSIDVAHIINRLK